MPWKEEHRSTFAATPWEAVVAGCLPLGRLRDQSLIYIGKILNPHVVLIAPTSVTDCVNVRNSQKKKLYDGIWDCVENTLSAQHKFKGGIFQPIVKTITSDLFTLDAD